MLSRDIVFLRITNRWPAFTDVPVNGLAHCKLGNLSKTRGHMHMTSTEILGRKVAVVRSPVVII